MEQNNVSYLAGKKQVHHGAARLTLRVGGEEEPARIREIRSAKLIAGAVIAGYYRRARRGRRRREDDVISIGYISLADIDRALYKKTPTDPSTYVPAEILREFGNLFSATEAEKLPPHRPGIDHEVNLQ